MHFVYILHSVKLKRYYVGESANVIGRLKKHNNGGVKSTKGGVPWEIIACIEVKDRSEGVRLERKIKKRGAKRYLEDHNLGIRSF